MVAISSIAHPLNLEGAFASSDDQKALFFHYATFKLES